MLNKEQALKLIGNLAKASVANYAVVNGLRRGSAQKAAKSERDTAFKILRHITPEEPTHQEVESALGW